MHTSIIVSQTEIGQIDAGVSGSDVEFWVVAEFAAEVEFEAGEMLLVESNFE